MTPKKLRLSLLILALMGLPWIANASSEKGFIVAIVNLECPNCREIFQESAGIKEMVNDAGIKFRYAPVPNHTRADSAWSARAYYASRMLPGSKSKEVMKALYEAQETDPLKSKDRVMAWLQMTVPDVDWQRFFTDHVSSNETLKSVEKAIALAKTVQLKQFPSFVYIAESPSMIAGSGTNAELVNQLKRFLENKP